jgi:hypothetical protein
VEPWFPLTKAGRRASWLCAALLFAAAAAPGDTVRTTAGRAYAGTVSIDGHALRVGPTTMPVGDVLEVTLGRAVRTGRQSCVLANGSTLAGRVEGIDDRIVRVTMPAMGTVPVPVDRVARVCFGPVPGELLAKVPGDGGRGLLLRDGDFFDGQLAGFDGANVTMTSPLLGEATFGVADRAAALVLRPAGRPEGAWVVRTTDGSVLVADDLSLTNGSVRVTVAGVGPMAVRLADVASIRAGGERFTSLADLTPARGSPTVDGTPVGLPPRLVGGEAVGRSVCVSAGAPVTYKLAGGYAAFAGRVGVPAGVVPMAGVRWSVRVDGRVVADGGAGRTSVDDPVWVGVPVAGAAELPLSVEPANGSTTGVGLVLFADPVLVRAAPATTRP